MSFEVDTNRVRCYRCGTAFGGMRSRFPVSYADLYKGVGFIPICRDCTEKLFYAYLEECGDERLAVRQVCRKLDLYWDDKIYELVRQKSGKYSVIFQYLQKLTNKAYLGRSYDDTLISEGTLWSFAGDMVVKKSAEENKDLTENDIPKELISYWGEGYTPSMYMDLEQRKKNWLSGLPEGADRDVSTEAIIKQLCCLEVDINRNRITGKSVDKLINSYNSLLGSANLKPRQRKQDEDMNLVSTPMGVWLHRYENMRPLPEVDDDCKDVNGLRKYVFTWMGHLCKMLGLKNAYEQMYQEEIDRLRVEKPEYDDEDDEEFFADVMLGNDPSEVNSDDKI